MALKKKGSVDETLEIVRDLDTFKERIEQLGKAQNDADASIVKASKQVAEHRASMEKMTAAAQDELDSARARAKAEIASIDDERKLVAEAQGAVNRDKSALKKRTDAVDQDSATLEKAQAKLAQAEVVFARKVKNFEAAAKSACDKAVG